MASGVYNIFKSELMHKTIDLPNDTIKVALLDSNHSFAASSATNSAWTDVSANEASGTGYSAGGQNLSGSAVTCDNSDNEGVWDGTDWTLSTATVTARHAVLYDDTITDPVTDLIICSIDFGSDQTSTAGDFTIAWAAEGIINLT